MINKENSLASFIGIQSEVVCVCGGLELHYLRAQTEGVKIHRNFVGYFVNLMTSLLSKVVKRFSILLCCLNLFDFFFS